MSVCNDLRAPSSTQSVYVAVFLPASCCISVFRFFRLFSACHLGTVRGAGFRFLEKTFSNENFLEHEKTRFPRRTMSLVRIGLCRMNFCSLESCFSRNSERIIVVNSNSWFRISSAV